MADGVNRQEGWNWLGFMPPQVSTLSWEHWTSESPSDPGGPSAAELLPVLAHERLPGILVWTDPYSESLKFGLTSHWRCSSGSPVPESKSLGLGVYSEMLTAVSWDNQLG
jgi:hypothetical protein